VNSLKLHHKKKKLSVIDALPQSFIKTSAATNTTTIANAIPAADLIIVFVFIPLLMWFAIVSATVDCHSLF